MEVRKMRRWPLALVALGMLLALQSGCYDHQRGNPVDRLHYEHTIDVRNDYSHVRIQTYVNRTQWRVGLQREDLYDGDRDGALASPGMDRVSIIHYADIEDPPEAAERRAGDLRDYDSLFQEILEAAQAGKKSFSIEGRDYELNLVSEMGPSGDTLRLG
jgi:hypothetical protein